LIINWTQCGKAEWTALIRSVFQNTSWLGILRLSQATPYPDKKSHHQILWRLSHFKAVKVFYLTEFLNRVVLGFWNTANVITYSKPFNCCFAEYCSAIWFLTPIYIHTILRLICYLIGKNSKKSILLLKNFETRHR